MLILGGFFLFLFLHPYVFYPASLLLFKRIAITPARSEAKLKISLVFAAYNEERSLAQKITNLCDIKARHPDVEIIAYCDLSSDRTADILEEAGDVLRVIKATNRTGKATGMARMASEATGDIILFTDANVIVEVAAIDHIRAHFANPDLGGLAGTLRYINDADSATAYVGGLYWRQEEIIKQRESACG